MKNTHLFILAIACIFYSSSLFSQTISLTEAQKVGVSKITDLGVQYDFKIGSNPELFNSYSDDPLFFAFQLEPVGFMIISANRLLPPVVAYSLTSNYKSEEFEESALVDLMRNDLSQRLLNIDKMSISRRESRKLLWNQLTNTSSKARIKFDQWPPTGTTSTGGWLETNWKQSFPDNDFCPMDPVTNQRSLAGCPSVAIAMLINYYETLNETELIDETDDYYHSYSGRNYWVDDDYEEIDFLSFPDINAYFDTITDSYFSNSPLKQAEISALIWASGIVAKQVYTSSISGTFGVEQAYDGIFRFGFAEATLLDGNNPDILSELAQNMMEARPALLAVLNPTGPGHNLVTDGYNTDGFYHLNFGFGGSYNGWYLIPDEIPFNLTVFEGVIVDIAYPPVNTSVGKKDIIYSALNAFPNPSSSDVTISYMLKSQNHVNLTITNSSGKLIKYLLDKKQPIGEYNIVWHGRDDSGQKVLPGVYCCELQISNETKTIKIIYQ